MAKKAKTTSGNATPTIDGSKKYMGCVAIRDTRWPVFATVSIGEPFECVVPKAPKTTPLSRKGRKNANGK